MVLQLACDWFLLIVGEVILLRLLIINDNFWDDLVELLSLFVLGSVNAFVRLEG